MRALWASSLVCIAVGVCAGCREKQVTTMPQPTSPNARVSGFNVYGKARMVKTQSGNWLWSTVTTGGPTSKDEVLRIEAAASYLDGTQPPVMLAQQSTQFAQNWKSRAGMPTDKLPGWVLITGKIHVYRRTQVKVERIAPSEDVTKVYMNTGAITFTRQVGLNPPSIALSAENLGAVHTHGLELLMPDKKSVSDRVLLTAGTQFLNRQTVPYTSKWRELESIIVNQLIPKRTESFALRVQILP